MRTIILEYSAMAPGTDKAGQKAGLRQWGGSYGVAHYGW